MNYGFEPLHSPPAPFAIGAVANGTYMLVGIPAAKARGPAAVRHQLHVTSIVPGAASSHAKRIAVTKFAKSLVVLTRLLGVVDALSIRTTEWTLEILLLEPVTETPPPSTR